MVDKQYFFDLSEFIIKRLSPEESLSLNLSAEESRFCRFNAGKIRQDGTVSDAYLYATLVVSSKSGLKQSSFSTTLSQNFDQDCQKTATLLERLRKELPGIPQDPYARIPHFDHTSEHTGEGSLLPMESTTDAILSIRDNFYPTGIYSAGHILRGQTNSAGSRHWFSTPSWILDYSLYGSEERAWKGFCGGSHWNQQDWLEETQQALIQLDALECPLQRIQPGKYRVYLTPNAVNELSYFLGSIFGEGELRRGSSPLCQVKSGEKSFSPLLNFAEDFTSGDTPRFTDEGELIPATTTLVENGEWKTTLVGPRSASEYGILSNGASNREIVRSVHIGTAPNQTFSERDAVSQLGTGLYISNLHYLNWSDRPKGRITGMTRYACFWVEDGEFKAPIENLRWDDTLFSLFGSQMEATTDTLSTFSRSSTYGMRSVGSDRCPGMLIASMNFTL